VDAVRILQGIPLGDGPSAGQGSPVPFASFRVVPEQRACHEHVDATTKGATWDVSHAVEVPGSLRYQVPE
jgi:hypothetical protein